MADGTGRAATRDPDKLVKEIEETRESLARTIDELTDRISPANLARDTLGKAREQAARPQVKVVAGVAVVTVAALIYLRFRRRGG